MAPETTTWQQATARVLGTLCAVILIVLGVAVLLLAAGTYLALAAKIFWYGWRAGWGLW